MSTCRKFKSPSYLLQTRYGYYFYLRNPVDLLRILFRTHIKLIQGMDVVDWMKNVAKKNVGGHQNVPVKPVVIESAKVIK